MTPTYEGRAKLSVIEGSLADTQKAWAEFKQTDNHGMVGLSPDGSVKVCLPGHGFDKATLQAKIDELLKG